ncbi:MAG: hypothetical protein OSA98_21675 [Rubripirellula sp.]|nr:hypothetical protein [Rubripirellula sp.]
MRLLYTLCWISICLGVILMVATLAYDILVLDILVTDSSRTANQVQRDTRLVLSGAGITVFSALAGMIVGLFVKSPPVTTESPAAKS